MLEIEDTKNWLRFQIYLLCETCYIFKDNQLFAIPIKITIYSSPPILCNFNKNIRCINYSGSTNIIKVTNLSIVHILLTLLLHINMMRAGLHIHCIDESSNVHDIPLNCICNLGMREIHRRSLPNIIRKSRSKIQILFTKGGEKKGWKKKDTIVKYEISLIRSSPFDGILSSSAVSYARSIKLKGRLYRPINFHLYIKNPYFEFADETRKTRGWPQRY